MTGILEAFISENKGRIDEEISRFMQEISAESPSRETSDYYEKLTEYLLRGGKRLRPLSVVAAYRGFGGDHEGIYRAAISVELLHASSLIHDDIMDESLTRRGGPAFHVLGRDWFASLGVERAPSNIGISIGILGGDSLLGLGIETLLKSGFPFDRANAAAVEYVEAYRRLIEGQLLDLYLSCSEEAPDEQAVLRMLSLKTGALFAASLKMGAILAGAPDSLLRHLDDYGRKVGVAFQIVDDILGLFGDPRVTGKPADSDVKEGKRTILIIRALERCSPQERGRMLSILGNPSAGDEDVDFVRNVVRETGSLDYARSKAIELLEESKAALKSLEGAADPEFLQLLSELADALVFRNR